MKISGFERSILVFPPFISRKRYLAHKIVDSFFFPFLCSFSVGRENKRSVVIGSTDLLTRCCIPFACIHRKLFCISKVQEFTSCICRKRLKSLISSDSAVNTLMSATKQFGNGNLLKKGEQDGSAAAVPKIQTSRSVITEKQKRPDKPLYVPRALRGLQTKASCNENKLNHLNECTSQNKVLNGKLSKTKSVSKRTKDDMYSVTVRSNPVQNDLVLKTELSSNDFESLDNQKSCTTNNYSEGQQKQAVISYSSSATSSELGSSKEFESSSNVLLEHKEVIQNDVNKINIEQNNFDSLSGDGAKNYSERSCLPSDNQTFVRIEMPGAYDQKSHSEGFYAENEDSWETKFSDSGDCLNAELRVVTGHLEMHAARCSYSEWKTYSGDISEGFENVIELFGFPVEFNTQDLMSAFSMFQKTSYTIKWVDDCHALAVFSSPSLANQALQLNHPFVKVRPLSEGTSESKTKARLCARILEPPKPRPVTSAALARRLVSGALGLKVQTSKEQRDVEKKLLTEARERKRLEAKQRQDIWDGIVS
ncbi:coiled-coil domain-containing protein R3HCC1L-like isoform X2 [Stegodyphus dumicola]|uniref:coiled-coil domain-containing protein R3HCC1L-like isoform X2 n=1 Tax=Stegodyphus dumicola TaxID=202533 RepID=UPI0015AC68A7|nr:coiled-coil domain-containing protein R3HCC1L-like isoform X2 [Stegodyphus dumicola]